MLVDGEMARIVEQMELALSKGSSDIYQRGDQLVQLLPVPDAPPRISILDEPAVTFRLSKTVKFRKFASRGKGEAARLEAVRTDPVPKYVKSLLSSKRWPTIRVLNGIIDAPTLRSDGSILQDPGYDKATGLYAAIGTGWPRIAEHPTHDDARRAIVELLEPFKEFDWSDNASISAFVCLILATLIRESLPKAPAMLIDAAQAGSGKSMLTDCASIIATGTAAPLEPFPENDDEEIRKIILSKAIGAQRMLTFDNVRTGWGIDSPALNMLLTSEQFGGRILGQSKSVNVPTRMSVVFTGNNIRPIGDLVRRCVGIRLIPSVEFPQNRTFAIPDLVGYVTEHRKRLAVAALTILRAHTVASRPQCGLHPVGSFEVWSRTVRAAAVWVGLADPAASQTRFQADDDDREAVHSLLAALARLYPASAEFKARDIYAVWAMNEDLREAIRPARDGQAPSLESIGRILAARKDRKCAGLVLRSSRHRENALTYWIERDA